MKFHSKNPFLSTRGSLCTRETSCLYTPDARARDVVREMEHPMLVHLPEMGYWSGYSPEGGYMPEMGYWSGYSPEGGYMPEMGAFEAFDKVPTWGKIAIAAGVVGLGIWGYTKLK